jgi:hypothetical protein
MKGRSVATLVAAVLCGGCAVQLEGPPRRQPPPPVVVVRPAPPPPPPAEHVPPGQIRAAEVHERNAARKAAHDAEKAARQRERSRHDDDDDDDDDDEGRGHGKGRHHD